MDAAQIELSSNSFEAIEAIVEIFKNSVENYLKLNEFRYNKSGLMMDERMGKSESTPYNKINLITCE
jgi:hypothetical protein